MYLIEIYEKCMHRNVTEKLFWQCRHSFGYSESQLFTVKFEKKNATLFYSITNNLKLREGSIDNSHRRSFIT